MSHIQERPQLLKTVSFFGVATAESDIVDAFRARQCILIKRVPLDCDAECKHFAEICTRLGPLLSYGNSKYGEAPIHRIERATAPLVVEGLDWHTEDSYPEVPPSVVALLCLRGHPDVFTYIGKLCGPDSPNHRIIVKPDPYLRPGEPAHEVSSAFVTRRGIGWRYDPALIHVDGEPKRECVSISELTSCCLEAGDLLCVDNHRFAHARSGVAPDGARILLRAIIE